MTQTVKAKHTPWHLVSDGPTTLRIAADYEGQASSVAITIGSTALSFHPRRRGSHRGETMRYEQFFSDDIATARLIAAAPALLEALRALENISGPTDELGRRVLAQARAAIALAEGGE